MAKYEIHGRAIFADKLTQALQGGATTRLSELLMEMLVRMDRMEELVSDYRAWATRLADEEYALLEDEEENDEDYGESLCDGANALEERANNLIGRGGEEL
jgi:hypothetical protein